MSSTGPTNLFVRFCVLAALLIAITSWLGYHFGWSIKVLAWFNGIVVLGASVAGLAGKRVKESFGQGVERLVRPVLEYVLATPRLVIIALVVILAGSFTSSVTVIAPSTTPMSATLAFADTKTEHELRNGRTRFSCLTTPMGRAAQLRVEGYLNETFTVYPIWGRTLEVDRDLRRAPSVLFRVPINVVEGDRVFTVRNGTQQVELETRKRAIIVGPRASVSLQDHELVEAWRLQLMVQSGRFDARAITDWLDPLYVADIQPRPGDTIVVEYRSAQDGEDRAQGEDPAEDEDRAVLAAVEHIVGRSELQDVELRRTN